MPVKHVFVLMLENRSFDHLFGFSGLTGTDAVTQDHTSVAGLTGNEVNSFQGKSFAVSRSADFMMANDPGHEFEHALDQLCGPAAQYQSAGAYPPIDNSGFVDSYVQSTKSGNPAEVMKCFDTAGQLPVVNQLAQEFAVCDHWFASLPGPTWPNRLFAHGASSSGLDHSPLVGEIVVWETLEGFTFANGSLYDRLKGNHIPYRFYSGDSFPMVSSLKHVSLRDVQSLETLESDLKKDPFPFSYAFIEPSYHVLDDYRQSTSQHPLADMRDGEALIKRVYEAIRNSPAWPSSVLIVTWDESGGFYDHLAPPAATAPGDTQPSASHNQHGFTFQQLGPRVPALVISPLVPRNTIDHRVYEHASLPATAAALFQFHPLTNRDASANSLLPLLSLATPRQDAPATLVNPAPRSPAEHALLRAVPAFGEAATSASRPDNSVNDGTLPGFIHSALCQELAISPPGDRGRLVARVARIKTRQDAMRYLGDVAIKVRAARAKNP